MMERFHQLSILLAEDCSDDIEIARRALKRCGVPGDLDVARDGEDAIRKLNRLHADARGPDLFILDINLPRLNGFEVLSAVRGDPRFGRLPIVMMSASAREDDVERAYDCGANSYIEKPAVFDRFVAVLEVTCRYWFEVVRLPSRPGGHS